jgi:hypothetical protein
MRQKALPGLNRLAFVLAVGLTIALSGCGTASSSSSSHAPAPRRPAAGQLSVSPLVGSPTTTFELRFVAPASTRSAGGQRLGYDIGLAGPAGNGCLASRSVGVSAATAGVAIPISLDPAKLGGRWCVGTYTLRVSEIQAPDCSAMTVCPQFVRVVGVVARASFRVAG